MPHGDELSSLEGIFPIFLSYILSFINVGIYWNNHHHMMHAAKQVNGRVLWANIHLLFWLSLIPFASGWMGENHFTTWPVALYGVVLLVAGIAYYILAHALITLHGKNSTISTAIGLSFVNAWIGLALYALVAAIWFIPDRRIEKKL